MGGQEQRQKANKQIHRVGVWGQQLGQFINLVSISFSETTYSCVNLLVDHSLPAECFPALRPWSCFMLEAVPCCPACTQHLHPLRACSHLKVLSPTSSHALVHEDRWGDCDSAPFCCCIVFFFPWSENWAGETHLLPQLVYHRRRKKTIFLSLTQMSLRYIGVRQMPPMGPGEQGEGAGQVKGPGDAVYGRQDLALVPFSLNL